MKRTLFPKRLSVVMLFLLAACQSTPQTTMDTTLKVGDKISGMTLATGAAKAPLLWPFCTSQESEHMTTLDCRVPKIPRLAIGHAFLPAEYAISEAKW